VYAIAGPSLYALIIGMNGVRRQPENRIGAAHPPSATLPAMRYKCAARADQAAPCADLVAFPELFIAGYPPKTWC